MERSSKLADLKLVAKYYPVTNYSYPQQPERPTHYRSRFSGDRASLGSEGSSPSLIDDRTDSEVSLDDDYQYHAHASELWDSFWLPSKSNSLEVHPRKQYPALIPSPLPQYQQHFQEKQQIQQKSQQKLPEQRRINPWPVPKNSQSQNRKPSATYSPFPKPLPLPPRNAPMTPSWQCSRGVKQKPQRPPRPHEEVYMFRSLQNSPLVAHFAISQDSPCPTTPKEKRPTTSQEMRTLTHTKGNSHSETASRHSAGHVCAPKPQPPASVMHSKKSLPCMRPLPPTPLLETEEKPEAEPQSVFEYDDSDTESGSRSFWFHRRSASDQRKTGQRTAPSSPRKRQNDVIGRMLGRRSRG
ncbi:hypothetical protein FBEOM_118 [Fusarium beomiforme]|uniref:Uncharacterized protein n=1 Tax=Fusarium beomiforme TaxID=44412 RepID=A0A9P5AVW5_9HYPO|nr:hypothetical protein FBEOM_118 [Fusarium beomiforme]